MAPARVIKTEQMETENKKYSFGCYRGLTVERIPYVLKAGADSLAVVTDIKTASDPINRYNAWQRQIKRLSINGKTV